jgi:hypothetical protein
MMFALISAIEVIKKAVFVEAAPALTAVRLVARYAPEKFFLGRLDRSKFRVIVRFFSHIFVSGLRQS